jgi:MarR family transcriptional regulator, organic hydroperoxide resistance regulator
LCKTVLARTNRNALGLEETGSREEPDKYMPGCMEDHPQVPPLPLPSEEDGVDPATARAFQAMGRLFHLHRQAMKRRLSDHGSHHGEVISLRLLTQTDGMSQRDLAETLNLSRPRVTSILQQLEKAGAVRREVDATDQRVTRVFLTAEGRRLELENRAAFEEYVNATIGTLDEADKLELARLLDAISSRIAALVCPGTSGHEGGIAS